VSCVLCEEQKTNCVVMCQDLQEWLARELVIALNIITGDEMWVYRYDPETKERLAQVWRLWSEFLNVYGVVHYEFLSTRTNSQPTFLRWHISVVLCCACSLCSFACKGGGVIPHPPNSSHLVFFECSPFPRLKMVWKHRRFTDISIIQAISWDTFSGFWTVDFTECFEYWCSHWSYCIKIQGSYFEGNSTD
jgi:hypothetical protein